MSVIVAFEALGANGGKDANMGNVMSGIAEALIATGVGIFVAIPAVIAYNLVQSKAGEIEGEVQGIGKLLASWLKTHPNGVSGDKRVNGIALGKPGDLGSAVAPSARAD